MTLDIKTVIASRIGDYARVGFPAIIERFVQENGMTFDKIEPWSGKHLTPNQCFNNALAVACTKPDCRYVEGFVMREDVAYIIHHAWVVVDGKVLEPTVKDPENLQYFGVPFDANTAWKETVANGYYGLFDNPETMINIRFMVETDPDFSQVVQDAVRDCQVKHTELMLRRKG